jgi:hypothetical protein
MTGLIWLKDANSFGGSRTWAEALSDCNQLAHGVANLTDQSSVGDWRLPNVKELQSLIDFSKYNPALPAGHEFTNVMEGVYWSGTTRAENTDMAWVVWINHGRTEPSGKTPKYFVWSVRGGND